MHDDLSRDRPPGMVGDGVKGRATGRIRVLVAVMTPNASTITPLTINPYPYPSPSPIRVLVAVMTPNASTITATVSGLAVVGVM